MFFDTWSGLGRVLIVGVAAYFALIVLLRVSGNRTLSKMNAFDLIVTVALGSTLATVLLSESVALAEGLLALALLVGLQFSITWLSIRWPIVKRLIKAEPKLLIHQGTLLPVAMREARVIEAELLQAAREAGIASLAEVGAMVLETDGTFSVLRHVVPEDPRSTLSNVKRYQSE